MRSASVTTDTVITSDVASPNTHKLHDKGGTGGDYHPESRKSKLYRLEKPTVNALLPEALQRITSDVASIRQFAFTPFGDNIFILSMLR